MPDKSNKSGKLPRKNFLIVEEDDYPSVFHSEVLASSNRKLAKATVHSHDEDFDSDRETITSHKKQVLKALEDQISKFAEKDSSVKIANLRDKHLCANFPCQKPDAQK